MNDSTRLITARSSSDLPALVESADVRIIERRKIVQSIVRELMVYDVHWGTIPGVDKPVLFKPGTNMLAAAFGIALEYEILNDLSTDTSARMRVRCQATSIATGAILGSNIAEASQEEAAHEWRTAYKNEYDKVPEADRKTYVYKGDTKYKIKTSIADKAHAILEIAEKRAATQVVSAVLGIDDLFTEPRPITAHEYADLMAELKIKGMSVETAREILAEKRHFDGELWELNEVLVEWMMDGLRKKPDIADRQSGEVFDSPPRAARAPQPPESSPPTPAAPPNGDESASLEDTDPAIADPRDTLPGDGRLV